MRRARKSRRAFALYEVLLGVTVFVVGVVALGRSVENCMNASMLSAEEDRVRHVLSNRMAEIQCTPGAPDAAKQTKVNSGFGEIKILQKSVPARLKEPAGKEAGGGTTELTGINLVTLTAQWSRGGVTQNKSIQFYVYRPG